ncbi:MAG: class I SAM-dependent methyltransferase [Turicibacter sp.]|nr:class I SAM-dependent methyltransferase [Turicibacter sp.]
MNPSLTRILPFAKELLQTAVSPTDTVVDATAGNGHDTVFLAGIAGHVHSFDIQPEAIHATRSKAEGKGFSNVTLHHMGHENAIQVVPGEIGAAIFNLGYLPGGDHSITTQGETTWLAVQGLLTRLKRHGLIVLVVYHGHEEGKIERNYIEEQVKTLDKRAYGVLKYQFVNRPDSPYILCIERLL